jgi:NAD(P)-dependent dehydrogenase (short-subunit alcohol dehydrogenase family)
VEVARKVAIVTGGGGGIGSALAERLAAEGAKVVVTDLDGTGLESIVRRINAEHRGAALALQADASDDAQIASVIDVAERTFGPVDLYFANAGVAAGDELEPDETVWDLAFDVNVRAHIRATRRLIPGWIERGEGYFVSTASAAGLLTQIGSAPYSVTKHAAVGFAEWLSVTYGDRGVRVSCLCPMGVNTKLLTDDGALSATAARSVLEPSEVAECVLAAMEAEQFLILPHPEVLEMYRHKGADYDRWIRGMRRYQASLLTQPS